MYFKEEQKFTQWWLWISLFGIGTLIIFKKYKQLISEHQVVSKPMSDADLWFLSLLIFSVIALFWFIKLTTEIDMNHISMIFTPFIKKSIRWSDVKRAKVVDYGFVGGWGIRFWTKYGTVYNIKGKIGLAIELNDGSKFLIGTQKGEELKEIIHEIQLKNKRSLNQN